MNGKNMSIVALVCGILGIVGSFFFIVQYFTLVLAIIGIVFGVKGRKTCEPNQTGMATAGLVLGIIGTVFSGVGAVCTLCVIGLGTASIAAAGL